MSVFHINLGNYCGTKLQSLWCIRGLTDACTKWATFCRWYYQIHFHKNYIGLPLHMLRYAGEQKRTVAFYVIPLHWYDTGSWNSSSGKIITYLFYMANIMGAYALATQGNLIIRIRQSSVRPFSIMEMHILVRRYIHTDGPLSCQYCADLNQHNIIVIYISTPSEWLISRQKNTSWGNETSNRYWHCFLSGQDQYNGVFLTLYV